ncbi:MAG: hypothetical protein WA982_05680 [Rubrobacteraceae bacterium]
MKKLMLLAAMLAMVLIAAAPALAQTTADTVADQDFVGDTGVTSFNLANQGDFTQTSTISGDINVGSADGIAAGTQTITQTGVQLQVPVSAAVNAQQVPLSAAVDLDALVALGLGL